MDDRLCLQGILYVLHQDIAWQLLSLELGFGSGQTCCRRLGRWQQAGVFEQLHRILLAKLNAVGASPCPGTSPARSWRASSPRSGGSLREPHRRGGEVGADVWLSLGRLAF
ncbi:transposase [Streptomyces sp. NPDC056983]|uniref:transposase n=1 Tax=Streptomyces sp. NPDC056983 TaxID=3345987 RepID=UPI00363EB7F0